MANHQPKPDKCRACGEVHDHPTGNRHVKDLGIALSDTIEEYVRTRESHGQQGPDIAIEVCYAVAVCVSSFIHQAAIDHDGAKRVLGFFKEQCDKALGFLPSFDAARAAKQKETNT